MFLLPPVDGGETFEIKKVYATVNQNLLWDLLSDKSVRIRTPKGARSYSNVDLYVSRTTQLGK